MSEMYRPLPSVVKIYNGTRGGTRWFSNETPELPYHAVSLMFPRDTGYVWDARPHQQAVGEIPTVRMPDLAVVTGDAAKHKFPPMPPSRTYGSGYETHSPRVSGPRQTVADDARAPLGGWKNISPPLYRGSGL